MGLPKQTQNPCQTMQKAKSDVGLHEYYKISLFHLAVAQMNSKCY